MLAAAMQTCSAALNSTATLVAYDLFRRHRPDTTDHQLVVIGKVTTVLGTILAIVASPLFGHYTTIFEGINKLISYVAPPITTVFLLGVFWKRASGKSAFITLVAGMGLGLVTFCLDFFKAGIVGEGATAASIAASPVLNFIYNLALKDFMLVAFMLLLACLGIMVATTFRFPEPPKEEAKPLIWEDWREPLRGEAHGHGLGNYRLASVAVLLTFAVLYVVFR
jgi:solute:Na+ symporter, SSS family